MASADDAIRQAFEAAEAAVPEMELKMKVIREAIEPVKTDDERQYEYLRKSIAADRRLGLALDYQVWLALNGLAAEMMAKAQLELLNSACEEPGPLLTRMVKPTMRPPRKWRLCHQCGGKGDDCWVAKCNACGGHGYNV